MRLGVLGLVVGGGGYLLALVVHGEIITNADAEKKLKKNPKFSTSFE